MKLLRAVHATKVLILAFALAMPVSLPAAAGSGLAEVQTRTRHIQLKQRPPHHAWHKKHGGHRFAGHKFGGHKFVGHRFAGHRRHRHVTTSIDSLPSIAARDFSGVQTRTRHIRLKDRRHHFARRDLKGVPRVIILNGGYAPDGYAGYGGYDLPSVIPGLGTYTGGLSAFRDEGNGIYFSRTGGYRYLSGNGPYVAAPAKRAKIITVSPQTSASACSFEAGVCVVRP